MTSGSPNASITLGTFSLWIVWALAFLKLRILPIASKLTRSPSIVRPASTSCRACSSGVSTVVGEDDRLRTEVVKYGKVEKRNSFSGFDRRWAMYGGRKKDSIGFEGE